jgi:hypothetical protein
MLTLTSRPGESVLRRLPLSGSPDGRGTLACAKLTGTGSLQAALAGAGTFESFSPGAVSALMLLLPHLLALRLEVIQVAIDLVQFRDSRGLKYSTVTESR